MNATLDEAAHSFVHTAFSTVVRENWDFGFGLMDANGRLFSQSSRSVPSFIGTMPVTLRVMLERFPRSTLVDADVLITNDPWHCTGHLNDITLIRPLFYRRTLIGYLGGISHTVDIGGATSPLARDLYEEGLSIPVAKIVRGGTENDELLDFVAANVRAPAETVGDLRAQISALHIAAGRLTGLLQESALGDLQPVSEQILERSERHMRKLIGRVPDGVYGSEILTDGYDRPLRIRVSVKVTGEEIHIDYGGTDEQVDKPINSVLNFTRSYSCYTIRSILDPTTPNNDGSYAPIRVTAPANSLVNPSRPAPVWARHLTGHYFPPLIMSALAPAIPDKVMADSGSPLWNTYLRGKQENGDRFAKIFFMNGGHGARPNSDGPACLSFPSNVSNTPIEEFENELPIVITEKALVSDSGGPGKYRGGLAQRITMQVRASQPVLFSYRNERVKFPPRGFLGGDDGQSGAHSLNGESVPAKAQLTLKQDDRITFLLPSGGGMLPPWERSIESVHEDLLDDNISEATARDRYGLVIDQNGEIDHVATGALRTKLALANEDGRS